MYFVIRKNASGKYWWRAVADNNEILAASELMNSKASCENGISVVQNGAATAPVHDKTDETSTRGEV